MSTPPTRLIAFTVYGHPQPQGSITAFPHARTGRMVAKHPAKLAAWREAIAAEAQRHAGRPLRDGPLALRVRFYLRRPRSAPKRVTRPATRPDLDKLIRATGDALEGVLYTQDSRIVEWHASKHYGDPPRVEIALREANT